jgi:hypothetical protein
MPGVVPVRFKVATFGQFLIRPASPSDHPPLFAMFSRNQFDVEGADSVSVFTAMLERIYAGADNRTPYQWVIERHGEVCGHYGAMPVDYWVAGRVETAGLASNLLIEHSVRSAGLFMRFQSHFLREYGAAGMAFMYGLVTRPKVLATHLRTGFRRIGRLPVYARPYRLQSLAGRYVHRPGLRRAVASAANLLNPLLRLPVALAPAGLTVRPLGSFGPEWQTSLERWTRSWDVTANRTMQIVNWRFFAIPGRTYRVYGALTPDGAPAGYVALRRMPMKGFDVLAIVDLFCDPERPAACKLLLLAAHREAVRASVDLAVCLINPHSPYRRWLRRFGFLPTPESFTLVVNTPQPPRVALTSDHFPRWHVTWFDNDFV